MDKIRTINEARMLANNLPPHAEERKILELAIEKDLEDMWKELGWKTYEQIIQREE